MPRLLHSASAVALLLLPAVASAQDTTVDQVVSTATRAIEGVDPEGIGGSLSVLTPEDLERRQVRLAQDALRDVPGVAVSTGSGLTQLRIRGAEANHVLTLIDGVEASDPFFGEFDYSTLLADDVARIEVLRGQQSALYGSDAIAGVVHYITPSAREVPGFRLRAEAGDLGTFGAGLRYAAVRGDLDYVFTAANQSTDGFANQTDGLGTREVGAERSAYGLKIGYRASEALKLRGVVRYTTNDLDVNLSDFFAGSLVVDSPGTAVVADTLYWLAAVDFEAMNGLWSHSLSVQGVDGARDGYTAFVHDSKSEGVRVKGSYVTTFRIEGGRVQQSLTGAIDYERETYQSVLSPFGADTTRRTVRNAGLVAQYDVTLDKMTGGGLAIRHDDNDAFDDATTWRLHAYHRIGQALRLRAAAGTGIKNPGQSELYGFNAALFPFVGNPNLEPERSEGWEVGADLSLQQGRVQLGATWFDSELQSEIADFFGAPYPAGCPAPPPGVGTTCNLATTSTQTGFELFARAQITEALTLDAAYTHLRARQDGFEETRRPPETASVSLDWRAPNDRGGINVTVRYNAKMQDSNFSILTPGMFAGDPDFTELPAPPFGRVALPAYTLVNIGADFALTNKVQVFGRVENLLDENYWEVITYPAAPRVAYVGLKARF